MFVNTDNWEDCRKYYEHTFTKFKETGDTIFYIQKVSPDDILAKDINGNEVGIYLDSGYNLDFVLPRKTVYQYGAHAAILQRIPAKQWKKGMCAGNTQTLVACPEWMPISFDIKIIEGFVNKPSYISSKDAVPRLIDGTLTSAALSPRFSMNNNGDVFLDTVVVGTMSFDQGIVKAKKIVEKEIKELFPTFKVI